jgi:hypothetical protein
MRPPLDVPEYTFLLELTLEDPQRFFDVVSKYLYFHDNHPRFEPASAGYFHHLARWIALIDKILGNHIFCQASSTESRRRITLSVPSRQATDLKSVGKKTPSDIH